MQQANTQPRAPGRQLVPGAQPQNVHCLQPTLPQKSFIQRRLQLRLSQLKNLNTTIFEDLERKLHNEVNKQATEVSFTTIVEIFKLVEQHIAAAFVQNDKSAQLSINEDENEQAPDNKAPAQEPDDLALMFKNSPIINMLDFASVQNLSKVLRNKSIVNEAVKVEIQQLNKKHSSKQLTGNEKETADVLYFLKFKNEKVPKCWRNKVDFYDIPRTYKLGKYEEIKIENWEFAYKSCAYVPTAQFLRVHQDINAKINIIIHNIPQPGLIYDLMDLGLFEEHFNAIDNDAFRLSEEEIRIEMGTLDHNDLDSLISDYELEFKPVKQKASALDKSLQDGDVIHDGVSSDYRNKGKYMCLNDTIVDLEYNLCDDYGSVPLQFSVITKYPINYWNGFSKQEKDGEVTVSFGGGYQPIDHNYCIPIDFDQIFGVNTRIALSNWITNYCESSYKIFKKYRDELLDKTSTLVVKNNVNYYTADKFKQYPEKKLIETCYQAYGIDIGTIGVMPFNVWSDQLTEHFTIEAPMNGMESAIAAYGTEAAEQIAKAKDDFAKLAELSTADNTYAKLLGYKEIIYKPSSGFSSFSYSPYVDVAVYFRFEGVCYAMTFNRYGDATLDTKYVFYNASLFKPTQVTCAKGSLPILPYADIINDIPSAKRVGLCKKDESAKTQSQQGRDVSSSDKDAWWVTQHITEDQPIRVEPTNVFILDFS